MAQYTDEEYESFIKHNRDLVEKLMTMQKDMTMNALDGGKQFGMGAAKAGMDAARGAADSAMGHAENAANFARQQTEQAAGKAKEAASFAKDQTEHAAEKAKEAAHYAKDQTEQAAQYAKEKTEEAAEAAKEKTEEFMKTTYNMFTDPGVQKHFMAMGIEFMSGMSALMQKAPAPDFVKDAASGMESNWKQSTCRKNDQCAAKKAKAQKVKVEVDPEPSKTPSDVPKEIVVTDYTKTE